MTAIRILHASDLHLAKDPRRRSILDQASVTTGLVKNFLLDLSADLMSGNLTNLRETFSGILSKANIALLEGSQNLVGRAQRDQLNAKIDRALNKLSLSEDPLFRDFIADITRMVGFATSYHPLALDSLVNFCLSRRDLQAVILSGDIATTGFEHDLLKAREFLEGSKTSTRAASPVLANIGIPVWILPGNHDRFTYTGKEWFFSPGGTLFDQILGKHWAGKVRSYRPLRDVQEGLSVLMLAADFSLTQSKDSSRLHRFNKLAQGRVYRETLAELETETLLQQERERDEFPQHTLVTIWAVHFPPFFPDLSVAKSLLQATDLVDKAKELDVQALLAGHTHLAKEYYAKGLVRVLCAGTPTAFDSALKHCQILSVKRTSSVTSSIEVTDYEWDKVNATFRQRKRRRI